MDQGWIEPPFFVQMVFGILGGVGADLDNLMHMHTIAEKLFGETMSGRCWRPGATRCPLPHRPRMLGGNLRVGLEDSLYIGKGELATGRTPIRSRKIRASSKTSA